MDYLRRVNVGFLANVVRYMLSPVRMSPVCLSVCLSIVCRL